MPPADNTIKISTGRAMMHSAYATIFASPHATLSDSLIASKSSHPKRPMAHIVSKIIYYHPFLNLHESYTSRLSLDRKKFNAEGKDFFERLKLKYSGYFPMLAELFPYVKRFVDKQDLEQEYIFKDDAYPEIVRNMSICSAKYFDLYFSFGHNDHLAVGKSVKRFISAINSNYDYDELIDLCIFQVESIPKHVQKEWFEIFESHISMVKIDALTPIAIALVSMNNAIDDSKYFLMLSARDRVCVIVAHILEQMDDTDFAEIMRQLSNAYDKLQTINNVIYWLERSKSANATLDSKCNILRELWGNLCEEVLSKKVDLYSNIYYSRKNTWGLLNFVRKDAEKLKEVQEYISGILSESNVFRVLGDVMSISISNTYGYSITEEGLNEFGISTADVDSILSTRSPANESELFVRKVYEKFKSSDKDDLGRNEIHTSQEVVLSL